jgi:hypothetical protein
MKYSAVRLRFPGERFLRTGDLGFIRDGALYITGASRT